MVGAHASSPSRRRRSTACVEAATEAGAGIHVHVAEDGADQRDATRATDAGRGAPGRRGGADDDLLGHCVHLRRGRARAGPGSGAAVAHNARSNMNNAVGRAPVEALGSSWRSGPTGSARHVRRVPGRATSGAARTTCRRGPGWPLRRLAEGRASPARSSTSRCSARVRARPPTWWSWTTSRRRRSGENLAGHWIFGLSSPGARRAGRRRRRAGSSADGVDQGEGAAEAGARRQHVGTHGDIPAHPFKPAGA